jgi:flagellar FliL protein
MSAAAAAATTADATAPAKPKSKKLLFILIGVIVLALAGAGGAVYILKKNTAVDEDGEETSHSTKDDRASRSPPTFLPLEAMVVNLADPGGNRFAQLGITLEVEDSKTSDAMKAFMPSIRNAILMLVSQRSSETMLQMEGKEKLSADIVREVSKVMGYSLPEAAEADASQSEKPAKKRPVAPPNPLRGVLFSSFIVQ